jgi:signal transduction histidine kinase
VLYRIAQEALTNIGKHAQAKRVSISFAISDVLRFSIKDDGIGYRATEKTDGRHLGIQSMRERAAMLGGRLAVSGRAGGGTAVIVTIPIAEQEQQQAQSA